MTGGINRLEEIFHAAMELDSIEDRNDFLDRACADSSPLRARIDRMLDSHHQARDFLEHSPVLSCEEHRGVADPDLTQAPRGNQSSFRIDNLLPQVFGDYELLEKIAHGGMGVVFKARQSSLNRIVAIKMILTGQFAGQDEIKRFYVEAEAAGRLDHSGIVPVFDVGCCVDQHYYSMAFVEGQSLSARIKQGPLPPREAASMTAKIADAIQVAHDQGIVHRDLKPGNVLLDERDQPRVTDFGLAKRVEGDSELTTTGMVLGTPSFMPPEQAAGKEIGPAADVYSMGAILYAMLSGRAPFEGGSQMDTIMQVLQDEPVLLRTINKNISKDLEAICLKCLEKEPANRYATATELSADLQRFLAGEPIHAKNDVRRRFRKWTIREPVLATHVAATIILLSILFMNYWVWRDEGIGRDYNFRVLKGNIGILAGWGLAVLILQKSKNIFQAKSAISLVWAGINPIFLTMTLGWNAEPGNGEVLGWLLSLYFLLIVTSCFFRRVELVAITTVVSLIGYAVLLFLYFDWPLEAPAYKVVFGVNLAVTGALSSLLTLRMKRLGEQRFQKQSA